MDIMLRRKVIYRVTMDTENDLTAPVENSKWHNIRYEVYGLLCLSTSKDLLFNLDGLTSPNEEWVKLKTFHGNTNELRGHQLEN